MAGKLSTHVLDTYSGCPAAGMAWILAYKQGTAWSQLDHGVTNDGGRNEGPLLTDAAMQTGCYRLTFQVGDYFKALGVELPNPAFLDAVILQVNLIEGESYHVPLLVSPWSYSTYRGS